MFPVNEVLQGDSTRSSRRTGRGLQGVDELAGCLGWTRPRARASSPLTSQTRMAVRGGNIERRVLSGYKGVARIWMDGGRSRSTVGSHDAKPAAGASVASMGEHTGRYSGSNAHRTLSLGAKRTGCRLEIVGPERISKYRQRSNSRSANWHELCWKSVAANVEFLSKKRRNAG